MARPSTSIRSRCQFTGRSGSRWMVPLTETRPARIKEKAAEREQYPSFESARASPTRAVDNEVTVSC